MKFPAISFLYSSGLALFSFVCSAVAPFISYPPAIFWIGCCWAAGARPAPDLASCFRLPCDLADARGPGREGKELRRIPYLDRARNRVLEQLLELQAGSERDRNFDKLLFLNDAIFTIRPSPILQIC